MENLDEKLKEFAELVEKHAIEDLYRMNVACEANIISSRTSIKPGKKYTKVDIGTSGRFMVENESGKIYGIKAYGVIHRGHFYGTLDDFKERRWSRFQGRVR